MVSKFSHISGASFRIFFQTRFLEGMKCLYIHVIITNLLLIFFYIFMLGVLQFFFFFFIIFYFFLFFMLIFFSKCCECIVENCKGHCMVKIGSSEHLIKLVVSLMKDVSAGRKL